MSIKIGAHRPWARQTRTGCCPAPVPVRPAQSRTVCRCRRRCRLFPPARRAPRKSPPPRVANAGGLRLGHRDPHYERGSHHSQRRIAVNDRPGWSFGDDMRFGLRAQPTGTEATDVTAQVFDTVREDAPGVRRDQNVSGRPGIDFTDADSPEYIKAKILQSLDCDARCWCGWMTSSWECNSAACTLRSERRFNRGPLTYSPSSSSPVWMISLPSSLRTDLSCSS